MNPKMNPPHPSSCPLRASSYPRLKKLSMGFTLIELLVVVGILGILVTLVLQAIGDSKSSSLEAQIRGSLRNLNTAQMRAYLIGDLSRPDRTWTNSTGPTTPAAAVRFYLNNGYLNQHDFNEEVLNFITIETLAEYGALPDPGDARASLIWKRKP